MYPSINTCVLVKRSEEKRGPGQTNIGVRPITRTMLPIFLSAARVYTLFADLISRQLSAAIIGPASRNGRICR